MADSFVNDSNAKWVVMGESPVTRCDTAQTATGWTYVNSRKCLCRCRSRYHSHCQLLQ